MLLHVHGFAIVFANMFLRIFCMTDPTNFMKMFFHSTALHSMTAVSEKKEKDEGWNTYHVPGTVLVTLGIFFSI